ncbi:unnamed protein product [Urochloa humidicola]
MRYQTAAASATKRPRFSQAGSNVDSLQSFTSTLTCCVGIMEQPRDLRNPRGACAPVTIGTNSAAVAGCGRPPPPSASATSFADCLC